MGIVFGASAEWGPGTGFAICVEGETLCQVSGMWGIVLELRRDGIREDKKGRKIPFIGYWPGWEKFPT